MGWLCYPVWSIVGVTTFRWNSFYLVPVPPSLLSFDPNCSVLFQFIRSFCVVATYQASGLQNKMVNQKKLTTTMTLSRLQKTYDSQSAWQVAARKCVMTDVPTFQLHTPPANRDYYFDRVWEDFCIAARRFVDDEKMKWKMNTVEMRTYTFSMPARHGSGANWSVGTQASCWEDYGIIYHSEMSQNTIKSRITKEMYKRPNYALKSLYIF